MRRAEGSRENEEVDLLKQKQIDKEGKVMRSKEGIKVKNKRGETIQLRGLIPLSVYYEYLNLEHKRLFEVLEEERCPS